MRAQQLGVGAFLGPAGKAQGGATVLSLVPARSSTGIERRHKGGVDSKLCSAPKRESICDDFDAAVIEALRVDVEVPHEDIAGNCSAGLAANTGSSSLEREAAGPQDAGAGASSAVVTEGVNGATAATGCSVERQRQAEPAEQQSTEHRRVESELLAGRQGSEDPRSKRPRLGLEQGEGRRVKHCAEAASDAVVDSTGGRPLPSSSGVDRLVGVCWSAGGVRGQVAESRRLEAIVAEEADRTGKGAQTAGE